jgi:hypothetical protein
MLAEQAGRGNARGAGWGQPPTPRAPVLQPYSPGEERTGAGAALIAACGPNAGLRAVRGRVREVKHWPGQD